MDKLYFKSRDNSYYTKYTKEQIYNLIDYKDFNTILPFLKDMDYAPWEAKYYQYVQYNEDHGYNPQKALGRFIAFMRLAVPRQYGYNDGDIYSNKNK